MSLTRRDLLKALAVPALASVIPVEGAGPAPRVRGRLVFKLTERLSQRQYRLTMQALAQAFPGEQTVLLPHNLELVADDEPQP